MGPQNVSAQSTGPRTVTLEWSPIPQHLLNGILRKYVIVYNRSGSSDKILHIPASVIRYNITSLTPNTVYCIGVGASTVMHGPLTNVCVTTSPPRKNFDFCFLIDQFNLAVAIPSPTHTRGHWQLVWSGMGNLQVGAAL